MGTKRAVDMSRSAGSKGVGPPAPLAGVTVVDFSQFLAGPVAAVRLGDLGARVIKVERRVIGDAGRQLAFAGAFVDGDSVSFQAMNRGKESLAADLKDPDDLALVRRVVERADVVIENFRPGVMRRLGLDYESVRALNPGVVYGSVTGYGTTGPWSSKPGQDLLAQAVSGFPWLNGPAGGPPVPAGLSIADHLASCQLALGICALLVRRERTGEGGLVETSLLEGMLDLQFELLSAYFSQPGFETCRPGAYATSAYIGAPYGVYPTSDGYLALAMNPVPKLGSLLGLDELSAYASPGSWWEDRQKITELLASHLSRRPTQDWLDILEPADIWCAPVLTLEALTTSEAFQALEMVQEVAREPSSADGPRATVVTTRSPLRVDGDYLSRPIGAPRLGEHSQALLEEFGRGSGDGSESRASDGLPGDARETGRHGARREVVEQ